MVDWLTYKGLEVPDATPTGAGGLRLKDDLTALADRAPFLSSSNPSTGDDAGDGYFAGSLWFNTSTHTMWVCVDPTATTAAWRTLYKRIAGALILCPGDSANQRTLQLDSGGNTRGNDAVDLQANRSSSSQVASGAKAVLCGGNANTASGNYSFIGGGKQNGAGALYSLVCGGTGGTATAPSSSIINGTINNASGYYSFIGNGFAHNATSGYGTIVNGSVNTASAYYSFVGNGKNNTASGTYSHVGSGLYNTASGKYSGIVASGFALANKHGQLAHAAGKFSATGDAQTSQLVLCAQTTNNTATEMFLDGSSARLTLPNNTTWAFWGVIAGRRSGATEQSGWWQIEGVITKDATAGSTTLLSSTDTLKYRDNANWTTAIAADTTNGSLKLTVTGDTSNNVNWVAFVRVVEISVA